MVPLAQLVPAVRLRYKSGPMEAAPMTRSPRPAAAACRLLMLAVGAGMLLVFRRNKWL